jgi:hypothetical protein
MSGGMSSLRVVNISGLLRTPLARPVIPWRRAAAMTV